MEIKKIKPNFKPLTKEDLEMKVSIDEYKYNEDEDDLFIRLKIKDYPFIVYREIVIPIIRGRFIDTGEEL